MDPMRKFLFDLQKQIRDDEVDSMKFLLNLPDGVSEKITKPLHLFQYLMRQHKEDELINILGDLFGDMDRGDLKERVDRYAEGPKQLKLEELPQHQSFQQEQVKHHFSSGPNSPPEERQGQDRVSLQESKSSSELCSQILPSPQTQLDDRRQPAIHHSLNRSQSESRGQPNGGHHLTDRCQSENWKQSQNYSEPQNPGIRLKDERLSGQQNKSEDRPLDSKSETGSSRFATADESGTADVNEPCPGANGSGDAEPLPGGQAESCKTIIYDTQGSVDGLVSSSPSEQLPQNETKPKELFGALPLEQNVSSSEVTSTTSVSVETLDESVDVDCPHMYPPEPKNSSPVQGNLPVYSRLAGASVGPDQHTNMPSISRPKRNQTSENYILERPQLFGVKPTGLEFYLTHLKKNRPGDNVEKSKEVIVMREYQKELAKPGLEGKNCIICAPTGSGKTLTAGYICQFQRMKAAEENRRYKTLFVVCIRNLIMQQSDALSQIVVSENDKTVVSGIGETAFLSEYMRDFDVIVLTAQILVNCLKGNEVRMSDFDLIIMDECHHTTLNHPYNAIMLEYHQFRRTNPGAKLPQVVGLTASLGVGSSTDDQEGAVFHYIRLCANLDCTSITHVKDKEHLEELLRFNPRPKKDQIISVEPRSPDSVFYQILRSAMAEVEKIALFPLATASFQYGSQQYENWVVQQKLEAESKGWVDAITCTETLQRLNGALMLYDELRALDAKRYLDRFFIEYFADSERRPTSIFINRLYDNRKTEMEGVIAEEKISDNPKLQRLCILLIDLYTTNTEARGIILTKTRLSVEVLLDCIKELPELRGLIFPLKLVGQGGKEGRMTDVEQENALRRFRIGAASPGGCNLLIATDVAQEGLDMPKCNFVIRYNFVSSEIGSVQSRGRARAPNSECYLIVERNSVNEKRECENLEKEHWMLQALDDIDSFEEAALQEAIRMEQARILEENEQKANEKKALSQLLDAGNITIHCRYCKLQICQATDLRQRMNNYICIAEEQLLTKVFVQRLTRQDEYRFDIKTGLTYCVNCKKVIGSQLQYKQGARRNGYVISKSNVMWKYGNETDYRQIKKWTSIPFQILEETMFPLLG